jgi:hypothetical protein
MAEYLANLHRAHWHAKKCVASIAKARKAFGDDPGDDEPASSEANYGPDPLPRSRQRYLRLIG